MARWTASSPSGSTTPYAPGERDMLKVKRLRSADCVVGGFRYAKDTQQVGSLLLGLYNDAGTLDHVGFTSAISNAERPALTARLEALRGEPGFTGDAPGGPSRWSTERSAAWQKLRPELVVEVSYDQVTEGRFRHGTMLAPLAARQGAGAVYSRTTPASLACRQTREGCPVGGCAAACRSVIQDHAPWWQRRCASSVLRASVRRRLS